MSVPITKVLDKDPVEAKDGGIDWTPELNDAAISASSWEVSPVTVPALTLSSTQISGTRTLYRASGGKERTYYKLTNTIDTSNGERLRATGRIIVKRTD